MRCCAVGKAGSQHRSFRKWRRGVSNFTHLWKSKSENVWYVGFLTKRDEFGFMPPVVFLCAKLGFAPAPRYSAGFLPSRRLRAAGMANAHPARVARAVTANVDFILGRKKKRCTLKKWRNLTESRYIYEVSCLSLVTSCSLLTKDARYAEWEAATNKPVMPVAPCLHCKLVYKSRLLTPLFGQSRTRKSLQWKPNKVWAGWDLRFVRKENPL